MKTSNIKIPYKYSNKTKNRGDTGIRYLITTDCPIGEYGEEMPATYKQAFKRLSEVKDHIDLMSFLRKYRKGLRFYVVKAKKLAYCKYKILEILPQTYGMG